MQLLYDLRDATMFRWQQVLVLGEANYINCRAETNQAEWTKSRRLTSVDHTRAELMTTCLYQRRRRCPCHIAQQTD